MSSQAEASAQAQTGGGGGKRKAPVKTDGPPKRQLTVRKHRLERGEEQYGLPFADTGKHKHIDFQSALDNAPVYGISEATLNARVAVDAEFVEGRFALVPAGYAVGGRCNEI